MTPGPPLSAARALEPALRARPDAEAVVARSGRLTYRELDDLATRSARALRAAGVERGDRVAVSLPNDLAVVGLFLGVMRLGALWVGVNRQLATPEKTYILSDCTASVLAGDPETIEQVTREAPSGDVPRGIRLIAVDPDRRSEWSALLGSPADLPPAPDPLAPAAVAYTSGTTGFPKGALHSQHNLMLPGAVLVRARRYGPALRKADCFPLTILNLQVLLTLLVAQAGGTSIVMDRVDPVGIAEWLTAERPTTWNGAPAMLFALAADDAVPSDALVSLEEVWSGGSPCPPATRARFEAKFARAVTTTYGLTEAPAVVAIRPVGDHAHPDTSGTPLPHLEVRIVGDDGAERPTGETGQICVGPVGRGEWAGAYRTMLGYWERPDASAAALRDGWLHTGDLGHLDHDGFLSVSDRHSSLILRGGANVYPAEVERVIEEWPGVSGACVLGVPDDRLGERVVAVVERSCGGELDLEGLRRHCVGQLARYKVPERFVVGPLPRNSMGKVVRAEVAHRVAGDPTVLAASPAARHPGAGTGADPDVVTGSGADPD